MRHAFYKFIVAIGLVAWIVLGVGRSATADAPPNVVMIISDDQAWTDFGFMGHPHIQTPALDKLASQSLLFRRGYVPSSLCRPSLVTMATGLYPHQHKITSNDPALPRNDRFLKERQQMIDYIDRVPTLPRLLAKQGYLSLQTGKWWEGHYSRGGFTHGMTHGDPKRGGRHGDVGLKIGRNNLPGDRVRWQEGDDAMKPIFDFIDMAQEKKKPFFVWYAPFLPHTPHTPPKRLFDKYKAKTDSPHIARYWAMCEWFDESCGDLLDYLDEKKLADDTLVVFVTDNGWINQANAGRYAPRSKRSPNEGGIRTPIMVRWPKQIKPQDSPDLANSIDLAPTILKAAGLKPTDAMPGLDLADADARAARKAIFGEIFEHNAVDIHKPVTSLQYRWCIDGKWKVILPRKKDGADGPPQLYDLMADPHENKDLADQHPDIAAKLVGMINEWWPAKPVATPKAN